MFFWAIALLGFVNLGSFLKKIQISHTQKSPFGSLKSCF